MTAEGLLAALRELFAINSEAYLSHHAKRALWFTAFDMSHTPGTEREIIHGTEMRLEALGWDVTWEVDNSTTRFYCEIPDVQEEGTHAW